MALPRYRLNEAPTTNYCRQNAFEELLGGYSRMGLGEGVGKPDRAAFAGWPRSFDPQRAVALGFRAESSFDEIIRVHTMDELSSVSPA